MATRGCSFRGHARPAQRQSHSVAGSCRESSHISLGEPRCNPITPSTTMHQRQLHHLFLPVHILPFTPHANDPGRQWALGKTVQARQEGGWGLEKMGVLRCATGWLASRNSYIHLRREVCPVKRYPLAQMSIDNLKEEQRLLDPACGVSHIFYTRKRTSAVPYDQGCFWWRGVA